LAALGDRARVGNRVSGTAKAPGRLDDTDVAERMAAEAPIVLDMSTDVEIAEITEITEVAKVADVTEITEVADANEVTEVADGSVPAVRAGRMPEWLAADALAKLLLRAVAQPRPRARKLLVRAGPITVVVGIAAFLRFWQLAAIGFNSDEAVYAGTAASIAGDQSLRSMFPVFRAHPVLFQMLVALAQYGHPPSDWISRSVPATIGVLAVIMTYLLGARLYGRRVGLIAALLIAVMPYHVVVSRQVLLDGLMTLCAVVVLYCVVRYAESGAVHWLLAAGAMMGLTILSKETSLVLLGGLYAFFALTPIIRVRIRHILLALLAMAVTAAPLPLVLSLAGRSSTGRNYLLWQAFRRSNHPILFYFDVVPSAVGPLLLVAAVAGLVWLRRENTWRERLLLCWMVVPVAFFTVWPVKGYQYLLPIAPTLAVLAGRALARLSTIPWLRRRVWLPQATVLAAVLVTAVSLAVPSWAKVDPSPTGTFLAGTGGLPGGREAGRWIRDHVPARAQLLAIGPSMANVLQFYGGHRVYALSVSANPNERNPAYVPVPNPDRALRNGDFQYIVWDSYTADRARFFADEARRLIDKYHGVAVETVTVTVRGSTGELVVQPVIVIYEVRVV
jgi:4-amino-4-deoxy-L-arabinose transferase-like glycosyltransferase